LNADCPLELTPKLICFFFRYKGAGGQDLFARGTCEDVGAAAIAVRPERGRLLRRQSPAPAAPHRLRAGPQPAAKGVPHLVPYARQKGCPLLDDI